MGKKGNRRKTRWRVLPIGEDGGKGSQNDEERDHAHTRPSPHFRQNRQPPVVTTEKKTFNEEEYTKITTPRQDVLFKKGYLGRKKTTTQPSTVTSEAEVNTEEYIENESLVCMPEEHHQYVYTDGYIDQGGVYYINGGGYEVYDPFSGNVTVVVNPSPACGPPVLAAVSCQPLPLQPLEWFNPTCVPYKQVSTDSQGPDSSGSPLEGPCIPEYQAQPAPYLYPYMFAPQVYNMNGMPIHSVPQPSPHVCPLTPKQRKKKRRRRRQKAGGEDDSNYSSSDEKEMEEPSRTASQESSQGTESDSKQSSESTVNDEHYESEIGLNSPNVQPIDGNAENVLSAIESHSSSSYSVNGTTNSSQIYQNHVSNSNYSNVHCNGFCKKEPTSTSVSTETDNFLNNDSEDLTEYHTITRNGYIHHEVLKTDSEAQTDETYKLDNISYEVTQAIPSISENSDIPNVPTSNGSVNQNQSKRKDKKEKKSLKNSKRAKKDVKNKMNTKENVNKLETSSELIPIYDLPKTETIASQNKSINTATKYKSQEHEIQEESIQEKSDSIDGLCERQYPVNTLPSNLSNEKNMFDFGSFNVNCLKVPNCKLIPKEKAEKSLCLKSKMSNFNWSYLLNENEISLSKSSMLSILPLIVNNTSFKDIFSTHLRNSVPKHFRILSFLQNVLASKNNFQLENNHINVDNCIFLENINTDCDSTCILQQFNVNACSENPSRLLEGLLKENSEISELVPFLVPGLKQLLPPAEHDIVSAKISSSKSCYCNDLKVVEVPTYNHTCLDSKVYCINNEHPDPVFLITTEVQQTKYTGSACIESDIEPSNNINKVPALIKQFASTVSFTVIKEACIEASLICKYKDVSSMPITEAVTHWLNSQSNNKVLHIPLFNESDTEVDISTDEESEPCIANVTDQKNVNRNPLPASSYEVKLHIDAGRRVANNLNSPNETLLSLNDEYFGSEELDYDYLDIGIGSSAETTFSEITDLNLLQLKNTGIACNANAHKKTNLLTKKNQILVAGNQCRESSMKSIHKSAEDVLNKYKDHIHHTSENLGKDDGSIHFPEYSITNMCDPITSVAKYYRLGSVVEKQAIGSYKDDFNDGLEFKDEVNLQENFIGDLDEMVNCLNHTNTLLSKHNVNNSTSKHILIMNAKEYVDEIGIEQTETNTSDKNIQSEKFRSEGSVLVKSRENVLTPRSRNIINEKLISQLKGNGSFPVNGICCLIQ